MTRSFLALYCSGKFPCAGPNMPTIGAACASSGTESAQYRKCTGPAARCCLFFVSMLQRWRVTMPDSGYNQFCPVAMAAEVLGARWTLLLLRELLVGSARFNDLRRGVPRMSPGLLSKRLKDLAQAGIITANATGQTGAVEYKLTQAGEDLRGVVMSLGVWGQRWVESSLTL